ncbi:MAG TPA: succinylglutamate-semialdehyde dehydrogenase [Opitutaceae bacterium]|nr:succinylglutamate-semialdehyde dehydrogenase [Opitutaceae bacterium]
MTRVAFSSVDPATGDTVWTGPAATVEDVATALTTARKVFPAWAGTPLSERCEILRRYAKALERGRGALGEMISREIGKPDWEAQTEVQSMIGKIEISIDAHAKRTGEFRAGAAVTRFKPHGVLAVLGPFNFPGHLPNGHIVPALLAGNVVVYKPSEYAPGVAELMHAAWREAGLPENVLQILQGAREVGAALAGNPAIDGLLFTGSARAGQSLAAQFASMPHKILALEMGGNNPLVVWEAKDRQAAALIVAQSAFLGAGQRCTCARRLIIEDGAAGDALLDELLKLAKSIRVGPHDDRPEPFMGPVVSAFVAERLLTSQRNLLERGARPLLEMRALKTGSGLLSPGILDVSRVSLREDEELFGPLLQVIRVPNFDAAIEEANATQFGLAAGLVSDSKDLYARFFESVRAGIVNWNQPLTGASSRAPFGGVGLSGNHRPSAYFAADYCAYPIASIEQATLEAPRKLPGLGTGED